MYGPPVTGKTLIARALANNVDAKFLKVVASGIVDKYIGESARVIREMFAYARENAPCIIFMDEIDAIGGRRYFYIFMKIDFLKDPQQIERYKEH